MGRKALEKWGNFSCMGKQLSVGAPRTRWRGRRGQERQNYCLMEVVRNKLNKTEKGGGKLLLKHLKIQKTNSSINPHAHISRGPACPGNWGEFPSRTDPALQMCHPFSKSSLSFLAQTALCGKAEKTDYNKLYSTSEIFADKAIFTGQCWLTVETKLC